jgi:hypothetical protein
MVFLATVAVSASTVPLEDGFATPRFQFITDGVLLMHVELRNINDIKPYPNNPETQRSSRGRLDPGLWLRSTLLVDEEGMIIVGDTRLKAARGWA